MASAADLNATPVQLVDLQKLDSTIGLDVRYATLDNFVGRAVYPAARVFLQKPVAEALIRVHRRLAEKNLGLLVFDGYRPWSVTKVFWEITPEAHRRFVANPDYGSRHNRGCAVDLSLFSLKTGQEVKMPSIFDEMTERSAPDYSGGTAEERAARDLLKTAMATEAFVVNRFEWWHFDHPLWDRYPVIDLSFDEIDAGARPKLVDVRKP